MDDVDMIRTSMYESRCTNLACCPASPLDLSDPGGDGSADRVGMILLEIVPAGAEPDELAIVQSCSETLGKCGRYERTGVCRKHELGIARGLERRMRRLKNGVHIRGFARDRQLVREPPRRAAR